MFKYYNILLLGIDITNCILTFVIEHALKATFFRKVKITLIT